MKEKVPFREGLFEEVSGKWLLVGNKCRKCGQVYFPKREVCLGCSSDELERINFAPYGKLYSYSIVHMPSYHFEPPYAVAWIEMPEGIRIFSQLRGWQAHQLKLGMDMEMAVEKLWDDDEGNEVIGYTFKPCNTSGGETI